MAAQQQMSPAQLNAIARSLIKAQAVEMTQQVYNQTFTSPLNTSNLSNSQPVITVAPRNVGLITKFIVKLTANIHNGSAVAINLTDLGPANLLSLVTFTDLQNNIRIQTPLWHLMLINSIKSRRPFGMSFLKTADDSPMNFGNNLASETSAPATIAAGADGTLVFWFEVPLAYNHDDLRGSVYANTLQATMQLGFTVNSTPIAANGTDSTSAVYVGAAAGSVASVAISNMTVGVYQVYLDQLPTDPRSRSVILPVTDLATIYELKQTTLSAMVAGQDFPYQYPNFRSIISTILGYVNTGATGARGNGTDINYFALQSANFTNIWKKEPALVGLQNRQALQFDLPPGFYYFSSRDRNISTTQYGNMELVNNPVVAAAGAYQLTAIEDFAFMNTISAAGSLQAN